MTEPAKSFRYEARFAVLEREPRPGQVPFVAGRYDTMSGAERAVGDKPDVWEIYQSVPLKPRKITPQEAAAALLEHMETATDATELYNAAWAAYTRAAGAEDVTRYDGLFGFLRPAGEALGSSNMQFDWLLRKLELVLEREGPNLQN